MGKLKRLVFSKKLSLATKKYGTSFEAKKYWS
jgi:hypothetical protein